MLHCLLEFKYNSLRAPDKVENLFLHGTQSKVIQIIYTDKQQHILGKSFNMLEAYLQVNNLTVGDPVKGTFFSVPSPPDLTKLILELWPLL